MANTGDNPTDPRIMHIRFQESNLDRVTETLNALDRGDDPEPYFERVYNNVENLHRVTRPKNLELLRLIAREEPTSIRETARLVDRDVRQVHNNLEELEELGLVRFEAEGRSKRPVVCYDEIAVELNLQSNESVSSEHVRT